LAGAPAFLTTPALAQTPPEPAPPAARVGISGERDLTLADAIALALENNPDISAARAGTEEATYSIASALGAFDTQFSLQSTFLRQVSPIASIIGGSPNGALTTQDMLVTPQMQGFVPAWGTNYQLSFTGHRQTSDNLFTILNPQYPSTLAFNITQPLFRGRRIDSPRHQIEVSRKNESLSDAQLRQRLMDITLQTELAYWDLVFARENVDVQLQGLDLASQQVESNRRLVQQGVGAPIDVVEAQTQVAASRQNVSAAQASLTRAENALKVLIVADRSSPLWPLALRPSTTSSAGSDDPTVDDAIRLALANRPELTQISLSAAVNESNTRFYRDQVKPQIDLVGSYTSSGLAGALIPLGPNPLTAGTQPLIDRINALSSLQGLLPLSLNGSTGGVPPGLTGGVGQSLSNLATQSFPTVQLGVRVALPFRNHTAGANLASSLVESRRLDVQRHQAEDNVEADVRNALQAVASARETLNAAVEVGNLSEQQYASEQRKFAAGTSTVFLVVQRQTALVTARSQRARAETDLSKSLAALGRATGQILAMHQIVTK
jgi:HAE1 family hydrophobic/amphiphilic exporter-1